MEDFQIPEFLSNETVESIHARMMKSLPSDIDKSEGQFPWDFTRPTALEKQYFVEFVLVEAIKQIFPMYASDEFLDYHGSDRNMQRKSATAATGVVTIFGNPWIVIPAGAIFSTESRNGIPSIDFYTVESVTIPESGNVDVRIECSETGIIGNVEAETITIKGSSLPSGITKITNSNATTGGTDIEKEDDYRSRIVEHDRNIDVSYVGSIADYRRWALSVDGVGEVIVIPPSDDTGIVTLVILDSNEDPANETLCKAVYNYIMHPDDEESRLTPPNAILEVRAPEIKFITIIAQLKLSTGAVLDDVKNAFAKNLKQYLAVAANEKEVKYSKIGAVLLATEGVSDYISSSLKVNDDTVNIPISESELPVCSVSDITFSV